MELDEAQTDEIFQITLGGEGSDEQKEKLQEAIKRMAAAKKVASKKAKAEKSDKSATASRVRKETQKK